MSNLHTDAGRPSRPTMRDIPANPIPDEAWNANKGIIEDLYVTRKLRLQDVIDKMAEEHGFKATRAQYHKQLRRWHFGKNGKKDHPAPTGGEQPRDRGQYPGAEPQPVEDPDTTSLELEPNNEGHLGYRDGAVSTSQHRNVESADPQSSLNHGQPMNLDDANEAIQGAQPTEPTDFGHGAFMAMVGSQELDGNLGFEESLDPGIMGVYNVPPPQNIPQGFHYNVPFSPYASNQMNIIDSDANAQSSQHAYPTAIGRFSSSQVPNTFRQPIHQAAQAGNLKSVRFLLSVAPECASVRGGQDITPLWLAAQGGYLSIVDLLLTYNIDVQVPIADNGRTPLHQAAQEGHFDVVKRLLESQANPDVQDEKGITPLWSAAQQGHYKIVKLLLDKHASVETASKDGNRRPIHQAAQNGHVEVARILLEGGAEANPEKLGFDNETPSPFWLAAQNGNVSIGELLIKHGSSNLEFAMGSSKRRPIHQATQNGHIDFVRLLIRLGVNIDSREEDGWTPLMMAAMNGHLDIVKALLESHANVNAEEKDRATAIWLASQQGHIDVVRELHKAGARIIATKDSKRRPIHQATQNGHFEVIKYLVDECHEDVNAEASEEATPLVLASQRPDDNCVEIMKFLHERGAKVIIQ